MFVFLLLCSIVTSIELRLSLDLVKKPRHCFGEEFASHELLVSKVRVIPPSTNDNILLNLEVLAEDPSSQSGKRLITSENGQSGGETRVAFTTIKAGPHWVCVELDKNTIFSTGEPQEVSIDFELLYGAQAKDYDRAPKKEDIETGRESLGKIEEMLKEYRANLLYQRSREERAQLTSSSTGNRVIVFALINSGIIIAITLFQMFYFKRFLRARKII